MAVSVNWGTRVISIPQSDLTHVSGTLYELDVDWFRLALKDLEDDLTGGISYPDTHRHVAPINLSGVTYARFVEIINGYTVTFEDTGSNYTVRCVGANHNIADVLNFNLVNLIVGNSAGLIEVEVGGGGSIDPSDIADAVWDALLADHQDANSMGKTLKETRTHAANAFAAAFIPASNCGPTSQGYSQSFSSVQAASGPIVVTHNLGYYPGGISVIDSAGNSVFVVPNHTSINEFEMDLTATPFSGTVYAS